MAITLIVEDGSVVAGANTYVDLPALEAYAEARGVTLPVDPEAQKVLLIKAIDYLESFSTQYKGARVSSSQALSWPRRGVFLYPGDFTAFPSTEIPSDLKNAQMAAASAAAGGVTLMPTIDPAQSNIKRDKVGPLETEFFGPQDGVSVYPTIASVDSLLRSLLTRGGRFGLKVTRA